MNLAPVFLTAIVIWGGYSLFELFVHRKERLNLIDKLDFNKSTKDINLNIFGNNNYMGNNALRIGLLLMGLGLGLLVGFIIYVCSLEDIHELIGRERRDLDQIRAMIYGACMLLFGGAGLLSAYLIERKQKSKDKE